MYRYLIISSFILSIFGINNCNSQQNLPDNYSKKQIGFGRGGGFTGDWTYYYLLDNGDLFKKNLRDKDYTRLKTIDKKTVKSIFEKINEADFKNIKFDHPGNMSYFVEIKNKNTSNKVCWGDVSNPVPANVGEIYKTLNSFVKDLQP